MKELVVKSLARIRPVLQRDGGDVEFIDITEDAHQKCHQKCHPHGKWQV